MSLYGRTDSNGNKTKVESTIGASSVSRTVVFVDETEAGLAANKNRGITGPGWWEYFSYTDNEGKTRHKAQCLMFLSNADTNANETQSDDTIAADVANTITISAQPANVVDATDPYTATDAFTVTASVTNSGTLSYQWQFQTPNGTTWRNCSGGIFAGGTTVGLDISAANKATHDGYKFRVKITSSNGAPEVISNTATLTFA